jgi:hypothetical protein
MSETIENQTPENIETSQNQPAEVKTENAEIKKDAYHDLPEWARKRMGELAAQKNEFKAKLESMQQTQQTPAPVQQPQDDVYAVAARIAEQKLAEQTFVQKMAQIESTSLT